MNNLSKTLAVAALTTLVLSSGFAQAIKVDSKLPRYKKKEGVSGKLSSIGSDTMNNLLALWGEGFKKYYPNVVIEFEGKGSSTAPPALPIWLGTCANIRPDEGCAPVVDSRFSGCLKLQLENRETPH